MLRQWDVDFPNRLLTGAQYWAGTWALSHEASEWFRLSHPPLAACVRCRACISEPGYDGGRRYAAKPQPEIAQMIHVFATITAQPGQRDAVLALFHKNLPAVLAETGCISYEAVVDVPDFGGFQAPLGNDTFAVVERWESVEALRAHAASAHMAEYGRNTAPFIAKRAINVLHAC
jgi:quinol monooxygenase YgiN